ncbi:MULTISPECIES: ATPase domain-containing protein [unclassified Sphingomonas]|uniref:ATPase domain-containing protein n=1 Tax=unclassified Sphingomonas TaxID=196159 RepID=UPI0009281573|nr:MULTISPECIES: ATPase domain-containing protein [unclassified Sphingomonas]OJU17104.1 MAG: circadian clock protein KaiC [Sphingomonas sp. 66-10]
MELAYRPTALIPTGVPGLDPILSGGYAENRIHLIEGQPGSGKTSMALQFLMDGAKQGELGLYITLSETAAELYAVAASHGWTFDGIELFELMPPELSLDPKAQQTVLYSSELELGETVQMVMAEVERVKPKRLVFDSLSEIRLLSQGSLRYRRQVLALKHFFLKLGCTVLMLDDLTSEQDDLNLHSISHGVLRLEQVVALYGAERRRLRCIKMRGVKFRGGYHDFTIERGGVHVYPRLVAADHHVDYAAGVIGSDVPELDSLVGGGLDRGTSTLIIGPSGSGKSSLALQFVYAALKRGEPALALVFDEIRSVFLRRAAGMGFELRPFIDQGLLQLKQIDPAELTPGELTARVRDAVEGHGARIVVLDSLSGYLNAMPEEHFMMLQMHEMLSYLNQQGIVTILVLAQHGMVGQMASPVDLTYLSDAVIMLRFFEAGGRLRRALSVLKKRTGHHEETIREYRISAHGVSVGHALTEFQGVLTGVPTYTGAEADLLNEAP